MTSAQVVETSVNVISNSPSQDYTHPDDRTLLNDKTPGFKLFTIRNNVSAIYSKQFVRIVNKNVINQGSRSSMHTRQFVHCWNN